MDCRTCASSMRSLNRRARASWYRPNSARRRSNARRIAGNALRFRAGCFLALLQLRGFLLGLRDRLGVTWKPDEPRDQYAREQNDRARKRESNALHEILVRDPQNPVAKRGVVMLNRTAGTDLGYIRARIRILDDRRHHIATLNMI